MTRRINTFSLLLVALIGTAVLAGCGSSGTKITTAANKTTTSTGSSTSGPAGETTNTPSGAAVGSNDHYNPKSVPSQFSTKNTNPYTPGIPGTNHTIKEDRHD